MLPRKAASLVLCLLLVACDAAPGENAAGERSGGVIADTVTGTAQGAWHAVQMPFEDLNIKREAIPPKLAQLSSDPYFLPPQPKCEDLRREIAELDALLGPDVCTLVEPLGTVADPRYVERGARMAQQQAVGMVRSQVDIIPFRGVVRHISGAEKHAQQVERAYQAGRLRRAFLKGVAATFGADCLNQRGKNRK